MVNVSGVLPEPPVARVGVDNIEVGRLATTRNSDGGHAMTYAPSGPLFSVHMNNLSENQVKAWWFNPRTGKASTLIEFPNTGERQFIPFDPGEQLDWILILDDASRNFPPPVQ